MKKTIYDRNASDLYEHDNFVKFMEDHKAYSFTIKDNSLEKHHIYVFYPGIKLHYHSKKRIVPKDFNLWHTTISLSSNIGGLEKIAQLVRQGAEEFKTLANVKENQNLDFL